LGLIDLTGGIDVIDGATPSVGPLMTVPLEL
jgi:hypothetical protein